MAKQFMRTTLALMLALLTVVSASATPSQPHSLYGTVMVNGANVADGTEVTASIDGVQYAQTATFTWNSSSVYNFDVRGDDPDTPEKEGGVAGDTIVFQIGGQAADQTASWQEGANGELNLTASGSPPPTPTPPPSSGDCPDGACANATIQGNKWVTWEDTIFPIISVGDEDILVNGEDRTWQAADTTGDNSGWNVTLHATGDFVSEQGYTIPISGFTSWCSDVTTVSGDSNAPPICSSSPLSLAGQVNLLSAATGTGTGTYDFVPHFRLLVPSGTIGGTYQTTVEVTISTGP